MVMNAGERGLSWRNLIDMRQFYLAYPKSVKVLHLFRLAECGRAAARVESDLADGGRK
jgi:hypothetical protein